MSATAATAASNKRAAQEFWTALERLFAGESMDLTPFLTEDFEWTIPESMAQPAKVVGREAARMRFSGVNDVYLPASTRFEFVSWTAEEDRVALHFTLEAEVIASGKPYKNYYLAQMRFRDGLLAEMWETFDTALAFSAFQ
jgi:ketosteroid isomerase-like protein